MGDDGTSAAKLVGTTIAGKYRVVQLLRTGGVAHVYLAEMLTLRPGPVGFREAASGRAGRPARLALKVLREELAGDRAVVRRFERGASAAARIVHPNVVRTGELERLAGGVPFCAMELLIGLDLADTLAYAGALEVGRAVRIAAGVAAGLSAAHATGVVHLDVKPENVFLVHEADGCELVKILDFGLAALREEGSAGARGAAVSRVDAACSTPEYMAPEQTRGAPATPAMDVFALGVMLREMLTGRAPGAAGEGGGGRGGAVGEVPARVAGVVERAVCAEPAGRFASMEELRAALIEVGEAAGAGRRPTVGA